MDGRDSDDDQPDDSETADRAHCRLEGFVDLVESGNVTEISNRKVTGEVMCEEAAAVMRAKRFETTDGTRVTCARNAHATIAPMTIKRSTSSVK